jgi:hypothetical protein
VGVLLTVGVCLVGVIETISYRISGKATKELKTSKSPAKPTLNKRFVGYSC